jgi:hypothetical protein
MPASSATIGCNIAALRVKVIGLAPCPLVGRRRTQFTVRFFDRSTSFGTKRVAGEADLGKSQRTVDLWTPPPGSWHTAGRDADRCHFGLA